jgi:putative tricarboxylic transport membrane protein
MTKRTEAVFALLVALLAATYLFLSRTINPGTIMEPGPGFVPRVLGVAALSIALTAAWQAWRSAEPPAEGAPDRAGWMRLAGFVVSIGLFIPLLEWAGSAIAIFVLVLSLTKFIGSPGWVRPLLLAAITAVVSYVLFVLALDVPLPQGVLF